MKIRALIVDDEAPARDLIATLLRDEPDLEVVGECNNGRDAIAAIQRLSPDLVFLDVQMPGLDGFGVLAELQTERLPLVVFVTAFDRHAIRVVEWQPLFYGDSVVILRDGTRLTVSRVYRESFERLLAQLG